MTNTTYLHTRNGSRVASMVLSTQVRMRRGQSDALVQEPVTLSFTFQAVSQLEAMYVYLRNSIRTVVVSFQKYIMATVH